MESITNKLLIDRSFNVAPMMDKTDRHFRYLLRLISKRTLLYTEMITTGAILFGDKNLYLKYNKEEHPLALQLGGNDPKALFDSSQIAKSMNYDEVNLNIGCPSDRVKKGNFGACLMENPKLVAECVKSMLNSNLPITVKCRIGTDKMNTYHDFKNFINIVSGEGGCRVFIIHSRIADLNKLSPKENRNIPPLKYDFVYKIKEDFPDLEIIINGGITKVDEVKKHLKFVDGVMMGRAAYQNPWVLFDINSEIFNEDNIGLSRKKVFKRYLDYVNKELDEGKPVNNLMRHIIGLYQGCVGARAWRRIISNSYKYPNLENFMNNDNFNYQALE